MDPDLSSALGAALGTEVRSSTPVHGGDVALAYRCELADGRRVFAKTHLRPPPGFFSTEASGLTWLAEPAVVAVAEVLAVSDADPAFLVLSWIDADRSPPDEAELGRQLAALHRAGAPCFGRTDRRTTGSRALPNEPTADWADFYASCRLLPLARLAARRRAERIDDHRPRAAGRRLDRFGAADEPPARLHGDLWAGNRLVDRRARSWLIDPAAHGGHREFDLAMMRLFGGFGPSLLRRLRRGVPARPQGGRTGSRCTRSRRSSSTPSSSAAATARPPQPPSRATSADVAVR